MANYLVRCTFARDSGLPADAVVNDWAITTTAPLTSVTAVDVIMAFDGFYNDSFSGQTERVAEYLARSIERTGGLVIRIYTIPASPGPLGSPSFTSSPQAVAAPLAGPDYPGEVAAVLSINASLVGVPEEQGNARPAARRKGRIYLGPLVASTGGLDANNEVRPTSAFITDVLIAADNLGSTLIGQTNNLGVFSRQDWTVRPVVRASMDNAFDTMRKRGPRQTTRDGVDI